MMFIYIYIYNYDIWYIHLLLAAQPEWKLTKNPGSFENSEHLDEVVGVVGSLGPPAVLVRKQFASATVKATRYAPKFGWSTWRIGSHLVEGGLTMTLAF